MRVKDLLTESADAHGIQDLSSAADFIRKNPYIALVNFPPADVNKKIPIRFAMLNKNAEGLSFEDRVAKTMDKFFKDGWFTAHPPKNYSDTLYIASPELARMNRSPHGLITSWGFFKTRDAADKFVAKNLVTHPNKDKLKLAVHELEMNETLKLEDFIAAIPAAKRRIAKLPKGVTKQDSYEKGDRVVLLPDEHNDMEIGTITELVFTHVTKDKKNPSVSKLEKYKVGTNKEAGTYIVQLDDKYIEEGDDGIREVHADAIAGKLP